MHGHAQDLAGGGQLPAQALDLVVGSRVALVARADALAEHERMHVAAAIGERRHRRAGTEHLVVGVGGHAQRTCERR